MPGRTVNDVADSNRCGTLRIGLFFDGTGNDDHTEAYYTNVKKLYDLYDNHIDPKTDRVIVTREAVDDNDRLGYPYLMSAYIRGVGSRSEAVVERAEAKLKNDIYEKRRQLEQYRKYIASGRASGHRRRIARQKIPQLEAKIADMQAHPEKYLTPFNMEKAFGGGLGTGGFERLEGMLYYMQAAVDNFFRKKKHYPKTLELDIFGFSRGAAQARHFVNVLKQDGNFWKMKVRYEKDDIKIRTLNLFDTVGSFYTPGKDVDPGYTYYINPGWVTDSIIHFVADDEYRYNFDGQLIGTSNDTEYPVDRTQGKVKEFVLTGAHSDIGGGYSTNLEHGISNNELSKLYLNMMYEKCVAAGVPLRNKPKSRAWKVSEEVVGFVKYFNKNYEKYGPNLKVAHKKLREWQAARGDVYRDKDVLLYAPPEYDLTEPPPDTRSSIRLFEKSNARHWESGAIGYIRELYEALGSDMGLYNEFVRKSNEFHNRYVHVSHEITPMGIPTAAMGAEADRFGKILHRDYFIPRFEDMEELNKNSEQYRGEMMKNAVLSGNMLNLAAAYMATANSSFKVLRAVKFRKY